MEPLVETKEEKKIERDILWLFDLALIVKIINGSLEVLTALLILFVPPSFVLKLSELVTAGEIARDADDLVATTIQSAAVAFTVHPHYFLAAYLALHGAIKVLLVIGIFAKKRIAYPLFMGALIIFASYEAYRGIVLHELLLQAFAVFDVALLFLTLHEYRRRYGQRLF